MRYKLTRTEEFYQYKGLLVNSKIRSFFLGRICEARNIPFSEETMNVYKKYGFIQEVKGIEVTYSKILLSAQSFVNRFLPQYSAKNKKRFSNVTNNLRPNDVIFSHPQPSIHKSIWIHLTCTRCQTTTRTSFVTFYCSKCKKKCYYCRHCFQMGRISSCTTLLKWTDQKLKILSTAHHKLAWEGKLTMLQQKASEELAESVRKGRYHLVNAVCGAGKTEILFHMIYEALQRNQRVCVATPRTDVVLELYPRFLKAFPQTNIHAYYGGAKNNDCYAPLVLATTHQLYKYEKTFDVMIVDEADAFPFTYDQTLRHAVMKSKKKCAPVIFVTATPSNQLRAEVKANNAFCSQIPIRYHNHLLPVPKMDSLWSYVKQIRKGVLPEKLLQWTKNKIAAKEPFIIFFPTIELMNEALPLFQQIDDSILSVSADDPERKEKVLLLRNEKIKGILSTTILERGITIKNVQVAVVGAENKVFTSSALIQIAGRVGRNVAYPSGEIVFYHHGISHQMDQAIGEIERLNEEAKRILYERVETIV